MRKIFCDKCEKEITLKNTVEGTFHGKNGHLVSVSISVTSVKRADICKDCIIDIIKNGNTVGQLEETWQGKDD